MMFSARQLLWFTGGLGIGIGISVLVAPQAGVTTRRLLRRRVSASLHDSATRGNAAEAYASHSASEEGMPEGPIQLRQ